MNSEVQVNGRERRHKACGYTRNPHHNPHHNPHRNLTAREVVSERLLVFPIDFILKNPGFLLKNPDFLLKNVDFITKT